MMKLPPLPPIPRPKAQGDKAFGKKGENGNTLLDDDGTMSKRNFTPIPPPSSRRRDTAATPLDRDQDPFPLA